jgi:hypothetical protein
MALPLIAAGIAARAIASKLATRAVGGIVGAGAKSVAPVYKNMGTGSVKVTSGVTKQEQNMVNNMRTELLNDKKSGITAKNSAAMRERVHLSVPKKPTIKVNSNPKRGN